MAAETTSGAALLQAVRRGEVGALARLCRLIDDERIPATWLDELLVPARSFRKIGVTGSPGAGKSTLVGRLVGALRARGERVGVIAVDPTSPFSGGALLGDRVRMQEYHADREVFIRSLATRGALGGLSSSAHDLVAAVGLWGANTVLIETVGVGQDELAVAELADTTVVVVAPGMGDDVQASKAGILEIADVFVVNKADRPDAARAVAELQAMLALGKAFTAPVSRSGHAGISPYPPPGVESSQGASLPAHDHSTHETEPVWQPPIVSCIATGGQGIGELLAELDAHASWLMTPVGQLRTREHRLAQLRSRLRSRVSERVQQRLATELSRGAEAILEGNQAVSEVIEHLCRLVGV